MTIQPTKILWPTDFSELSLRAASYARGFCEKFGAELHVIHVCQTLSAPELTTWGAGVRPVAAYDAKLALQENEVKELRFAAEQLRRVIEEHFEDKKDFVCRVLKGLAWEGICNYAQNAGIDLIIIGTHGRTGLSHMLIGSTAERVVRHASCPVLTIKAIETGFVTQTNYTMGTHALEDYGQGI